MLSREENELVTRVGPGTPGGELMRRYWMPAALVEELPQDGPPLPVRLLGEDLVLFRDDQGRPGLLGIHCSHRGADLSYGRLEDGGLRCIYHGWLYDVAGRCLEQPGEPAGSTFHDRIQHTAYPCREAGGMILAFLGPGEPPELPPYEFLLASDERRANVKIFHDCNYLQSLEGTFDSSHLAYLHRSASRRGGDSDPNPLLSTPFRLEENEAEDLGFGARISTRRASAARNALHSNFFILPNLGAFGTGLEDDGFSVHWHVPIDDTHHWKYLVRFSRSIQLQDEAVAHGRADPERIGYFLRRNRDNRYLQDREEMKTQTFTGMGLVNMVHDAYATETPGPIQDRTQEHLAFTDRALLTVRKVLLRAIQDVEAGREPPRVPTENGIAPVPVNGRTVPSAEDWRPLWEAEFVGAGSGSRSLTGSMLKAES